MTLPPTLLRAAEYVRMSTDLQCYSIANQQACLHAYAAEHQLTIVRTYTDGGRSGLRLSRREGLQQLLADVIGGNAPFEVILVYDVSRWGRFQDADEAAHYEFLCRRAGKQVVYCAEPFDNDGSPMASIVKGLKRVMAGEYSRELSDKVFRGQARRASLGFHVGARAAYGLRRMIIDQHGQPRGLMEFGQRKALQSDHVILVPGPEEEVTTVRQVFRWFLDDGCNYQQIADRLNHARTPPPAGLRYWSRYQVKGMLSNEKYVGTMVYNRTSSRLATARIHNPPSAWVRVPQAFVPLIAAAEFDEARLRRADNPRKHRRKDLIAHLRQVLAQHGYLSGTLLRRLKSGPAPETYVKHFGSIDAALAAAGYDRAQDPRASARRHATTRQRMNACVPWLMRALVKAGWPVERISLSSLSVNQRVRVTVTIPTVIAGRSGKQLWLDKRAAAVVALDVPGPADLGPCLILDPARFPRRTLQLSTPLQFERVSSMRCAQEDIVHRLRQVLDQRDENFGADMTASVASKVPGR